MQEQEPKTGQSFSCSIFSVSYLKPAQFLLGVEGTGNRFLAWAWSRSRHKQWPEATIYVHATTKCPSAPWCWSRSCTSYHSGLDTAWCRPDHLPSHCETASIHAYKFHITLHIWLVEVHIDHNELTMCCYVPVYRHVVLGMVGDIDDYSISFSGVDGRPREHTVHCNDWLRVAESTHILHYNLSHGERWSILMQISIYVPYNYTVF